MFEFIDTEKALSDLLAEHASDARYAIDTEFQRERTYYPAPGLIQLAFESGVVLVDPIRCELAPLAEFFRGESLAVAHAVDQDLEVLKNWTGEVPKHIFDTQIAAGFLGYSTPSLATLLKACVGVEIAKTDRLSDWTQRPLTDSQLNYAGLDVAHLLALHDTLVSQLGVRGRLEWVNEECDAFVSNTRSDVDPETVWWRLKESRGLRGKARLIAQEVAAWRERRARETNVPPRFVLPDLAIAVIAQQVPKNIDELREIRTVDGRHIRNGIGDELLGVINSSESMPESQLRIPEYEPVDKSMRAVATLVAAYVGQIGKENDIDPSILATRGDIDSFMSGRESRLMTGWRAELVGERVTRLVRGDAALAFGESGELVLEERSRTRIG